MSDIEKMYDATGTPEEQTAAEETPLVEDEGIAEAQPLAGDEENAPEKDAEREPII